MLRPSVAPMLESNGSRTLESFMQLNTLFLLLVVASGAASANPPRGDTHAQAAANEKPTIPNEKQATAAIVKMFDGAGMTANMSVKLGTCIPAMDATHPGQVACTIAVKVGSTTSETQADFYRSGTAWVAQPSSSQDKLPFPDPAL